MNKTRNAGIIFLISLLSISGASCRSVTDKTQVDTKEKAQELSPADQDQRAIEIFQKIFDLSEEPDRKTILPKMEALYLEIVNNYPKAAISHESYWRLVLIYLNDYEPPDFEKTEDIYGRFVTKYPDSPFRNEIDDTITVNYVRNRKWENLLRFYTPAVKRYIETNKLSRPNGMFYYSEAKLNLGDLTEAEKGYKIVIALFPGSRESKMSQQRLDVIRNMRLKQN